MTVAESGDEGQSGAGAQKVRLACMPCRAKKAKCSGDKPACTNCEKHRLACTWPEGRKRKRTRAEMEADFGKRPVPETSENERTTAGSSSRVDDRPGSIHRSGSMSASAAIADEGSASAATRSVFPPAIANARSIDPGTRQGQDSVLSQQMGTFASDPSFSSQPPATMFFGTNTGFPLLQPSTSLGVHGAPAGAARLDAGSGAAEMPTPHTIWQFLASLPGQGSMLPTYTNQEDDAMQMLAGMDEQSAGSTSVYSQLPVPAESLFQIPASHNPSPQLPQPGTASTEFSTLNPPPSGTVSRDRKDVEQSNRSTETRVTPAENAAAAAETGTPSMTGLVKAITNQIGYLEGDESKPYLRLHYFRVAGSTSVHPGINRICLKLRLKPDNLTDLASPKGTQSTPTQNPNSKSPNHPPSPYATVAFDEADMPPKEVYEPLLDVFFDSLAQHFPSIQRLRLQTRLANGTMSAFLLNAICAISARFAGQDKTYHANAGDVFANKAMELLVPALRLPTTDAITSLLLLSQCEFGQNSESGYWHVLGLAIRMAEHMGSYKDAPEIFEDKDHYTRNKLLLWSLFVQDRLLSLSTGRLCTIRDDMVELPLPTDKDMIPAPLPAGLAPISKPEPFVALVKLMVIAGRISDLLNGNRGAAKILGAPMERDLPKRMQTLQTELVQFYNDLPENLIWSTTNFKFWVSEHKGGVFLALHCTANAILALLYHPALLTSPNGADTPMSQGMQRSIKLSLTCSRAIAEFIVFADLGSPISFIATPQITQALYVAGLAFVHEMRTSEFQLDARESRPSGSSEAFLHLIDKQNLEVIVNALKKMENAWAGAGVMLYVLQKRAAGYNRSGIDFDKSSEDIPTFVSVPDTGVLRRFTEPGALSGSDFKALIAGLSARSPSATSNVNAAAEGEPGSLGDLLSRYSVDDYNIDFLNSADFALLSGGMQFT
ncbi:hypothetical protein NliqN6_5361 [Naganishia liquefaciens]|uniref:Zn(2)-C6 fungal-type domain-containing protein n=1 Tax=Naganishia liquefaciens TaxID=104408 RepID=A0A8H3YGN9_9TREE|nr:hypothetical protein NliqN6_5361 [Naganishia liquefaciens]